LRDGQLRRFENHSQSGTEEKMAFRESDAWPYLKLKQQMEPSDCDAVLKNGSKLEVFIYRGKPVIEVDRQFYPADMYPTFVQYEKKPVAAPIPEPVVQEVDKQVTEESVDTSGQRLRLQLQRNSDAIYKRNIIRQVFGNLEVKEYLGVGERDSTTRYWSCYCKAHGKYITATQADLITDVVRCCTDVRKRTEAIANRGARMS
jgi:hypothetical protein